MHRLIFFFFNDTATTEIYTLSLHDALPICARSLVQVRGGATGGAAGRASEADPDRDEGRSRRREEIGRAHGLNSSHANISYAGFCLKKKKIEDTYRSSLTLITDRLSLQTDG